MSDPSLGSGQAGCLFCAIVAGAVPAEIVASNEHAVCFRDVHPAAPTHLLVVPRDHLEDATELGPEHAAVLSSMLQLANEQALAEGIATHGYRLVFNVGEDAGNTVGHIHLHVLGGRALGPLA